MGLFRSLGQDGIGVLTPMRVIARLSRRRSAEVMRRRGMASAGPRPIDPYISPRSSSAVIAETVRIVDPARGVAMDCTVRRPERCEAPLPVVVYSVPMDWSTSKPTADGAHIAEHLAAAGYLAVTVRHPDTDRLVFPEYPADRRDTASYGLERAEEPASQLHRIADLRFLLDALEVWNDRGPLQGLVDLDRIGMSGHSFGGLAAMALAGQKVAPDLTCCRDARVKAVATYGIMCSPVGAPAQTYTGIHVPVLYVVGAFDHTYGRWYTPSDKLAGFRRCPARNRYAVMLDLADHHTYPGGRTIAGNANNGELLCQQWTRCLALAFWDAWLLGDAAARRWLEVDMEGLLDGDGRMWRK
ncbi:MAG: alpha/beta hydrolase family protein [Sphingomonadales bacterium]